MSSNTIYSSSKAMPYVYMCINKATNQFYIGSRTTKKLKHPSHIDFPKYKTSSKVVKPNFEQYDWFIIAEFFNSDDAFTFEQSLIKENWGNPLLLNGAFVSENLKFNPGQSKQSREKARERMLSKNNPAYNQSQETREKTSKTVKLLNSLMTPEERSKKYGTFGDHNPARRSDVRAKLSKPHDSKNTYTLISPTNIIFTTKNLNNFCKEHNLNRDILMSYANRGKIPAPPNFGHQKRMNTIGWEIRRD
jgi:hypothetical protein